MAAAPDPLSGPNGMRVAVEHRFAAPPAQVWALLADIPRMALLSPEVVGATWLDDRTFSATNSRGGMTWTVTCHLLVSEPLVALAWCVSDPENPSSTWRYDLAAQDEGTVVRQEFRHGPGASMVRRMIEQGADAAETIAWRGDMLAADMLEVLRAADRMLDAERPDARRGSPSAD